MEEQHETSKPAIYGGIMGRKKVAENHSHLYLFKSLNGKRIACYVLMPWDMLTIEEKLKNRHKTNKKMTSWHHKWLGF